MYEGMYEEIPSYGLDCSDTSDLTVYNIIRHGHNDVEFMQGVGGLTFVLVCLILFLVALLAFVQFKKCIMDRIHR